ncbi:MAG: hypothetical protein PHV02_08700 [Rhodocyclaceae bacterium]|nr:hypothetical protein [Rhodocyclaceae bacterium]
MPLIDAMRADFNRLAAFRIALGEWKQADAQEIGLAIRAIIAGKDTELIAAWAGWCAELVATYHGPTPINSRPCAHACTSCRHLTKPARSDGACAQRTDLPPAYGPGHPLHLLPADGGSTCQLWSAP